MVWLFQSSQSSNVGIVGMKIVKLSSSAESFIFRTDRFHTTKIVHFWIQRLGPGRPFTLNYRTLLTALHLLVYFQRQRNVKIGSESVKRTLCMLSEHFFVEHFESLRKYFNLDKYCFLDLKQYLIWICPIRCQIIRIWDYSDRIHVLTSHSVSCRSVTKDQPAC